MPSKLGRNSNELTIGPCIQTPQKEQVTESDYLMHFRFFFWDLGSEAAV